MFVINFLVLCQSLPCLLRPRCLLVLFQKAGTLLLVLPPLHITHSKVNTGTMRLECSGLEQFKGLKAFYEL